MKATIDLIIRDLFTDLQAMKLNDSQVTLVKSMKRYYQKHKTVTEAQLKTLLEIKKYCK